MIGRTVKVGAPWTINVTYPMPNGKKEAVTDTYNMIGREENNGHDGIRLHYSKRHDLKAMAESRAYFFKEMLAGDDKNAPAPHVTIEQATEEGDDVVDAVTLQPLSSSSSSTIVSVLTGTKDQTMEITETSDEDTSVDYHPGAFTMLPRE